MSFRTRPRRGPSPGFSPPGNSDAFSRCLASLRILGPHLAEDFKRKVAVKVLRPELAAVLEAERFVQEVNTTANLQHPHIFRKPLSYRRNEVLCSHWRHVAENG